MIHLPHLLTDSSFERIGQRDPGPLLPAGLLNELPKQTVGFVSLKLAENGPLSH